MSDLLSKVFYGNTLAQWIIALSIIIAAYILSKIVYWLTKTFILKFTKKTKNRLDDILVDTLEKPILLAIIIAGMWYGIFYLNMSVEFEDFMKQVFYIAITFNIAWLLVRFIDGVVVNYLEPVVTKAKSDLDDQLLPLVRKTIKIAIWAFAVIITLTNAGYDVGALLAGLGIGGIAMAMAAKDTIANLFGGFTVFTDKPFMTGDRIIADGFDGTVKEIGFRSTRLRTLAGRIVTIPNVTFTSQSIENISSEPCRKMSMNLGLTYDTTPQDMKKAKEILKDIVMAHQDLVEEDYVAIFDSFGDFSLNLLFIYYITKGSDYWLTVDTMNSEVLERFNNAGLDFAFPTQTIITQNEA